MRRAIEWFAPLLLMCFGMDTAQHYVGRWPGVGIGVLVGLATAGILHLIGRVVDRRESERSRAGAGRPRVGPPRD